LTQVKENSVQSETEMNSLLQQKEEELATAQKRTLKLEQDLAEAEATQERALRELDVANEHIVLHSLFISSHCK
jgi:hypothetical protein